MTNREFYMAIIEANVNDDLSAYAQEAIERLDRTNAKRREVMAVKNAEKAAAKAPIREAILACITDEPKTATMLIGEAGVEIKPQAVPSLVRGLVEDGTIVKTSVKVKGKGKQVGYVRG